MFKKLALAFAAVCFAACGTPTKAPGLSKSLSAPTSLGNLVRVDYVESIKTDKDPVNPKPDEIICILNFEGKDAIEYKDVEASKVFDVFNLPLVDSNGKEFKPVFSGTPGTDGVVLSKAITANGTMGGKDGKWVATGRLGIPGSRIVLVYTIPKTSTGLSLKDGGSKHSIE